LLTLVLPGKTSEDLDLGLEAEKWKTELGGISAKKMAE